MGQWEVGQYVGSEGGGARNQRTKREAVVEEGLEWVMCGFWVRVLRQRPLIGG